MRRRAEDVWFLLMLCISANVTGLRGIIVVADTWEHRSHSGRSRVLGATGRDASFSYSEADEGLCKWVRIGGGVQRVVRRRAMDVLEKD